MIVYKEGGHTCHVSPGVYSAASKRDADATRDTEYLYVTQLVLERRRDTWLDVSTRGVRQSLFTRHAICIPRAYILELYSTTTSDYRHYHETYTPTL